MKVLFNCYVPFTLAHGGAQIQITQTLGSLTQVNIEAEPLRWWDDTQHGDILHHFGALSPSLVRLAKTKGWKVVCTLLLTAQCNRPEVQLLLRRLCIRTALALPLPGNVRDLLPWQAFRLCDRMVVGLRAESDILEQNYGVKKRAISVVPLGLTNTFLNTAPATRTEKHLVCTGTITPSKNSLELARLAIEAKTPLLFVGKPYDYTSAYWEEFRTLIDGLYVKHLPHVPSAEAIVEILRSSRGFVLMSRYENWSLAAHEAAGCGLPLLLPDQPWSRECFGLQASYFPKRGRKAAVAALRTFYNDTPHMLPPQVRLYSWLEVARSLREIYAELLGARD